MKVDRSELLLTRVTQAGYCYACVASDCFMIFKDNNELNKHIRSSRNKSHEPFATYLDARCPECEDGCGPDHDYFCHPKTYEERMRELLPYNIPPDHSIPRFSLCFDVVRAFRDGLDSSSSPVQQGDLMLYDLAECLHKRLMIMENELRRCSGEDHFNKVFGSPTRSIKDIRVLLREQPSSPNLVNCPAPGCQETFPSPLGRIDHLKASNDQSHLFYKSILDETYCFPCGKEFNLSTSLAKHNKRTHGVISSSRINIFHQICTTEQPQVSSSLKRKPQYIVRFDNSASKRNCQHDKHNDKHEKLQTLSQQLQPARPLGKAPNISIQDQTLEIPPSANCSIPQQDILGDGFFQPSQLLNPLSDNIGFDENELMRKLLSHDCWDQLVPLPDLHLLDPHTVSENPNIQDAC
ncbi:hypothetical protein ACJ73_08830 [Blastomyces percursus]|uniref:C2H2-type domain-containing protein n=1 Tax=Blastomyces percursus TaxID=1658174 RepID=A0A1J9QP44_9EURO|nr:hypothetical protein ACJ73_08830 [Blastomyces percursus]